jgi:hypothetical protein
MTTLLQQIAAASIVAALAMPVHASPCVARSAATLTPLVELYTSEGCSSCPPADRWLSQTFAGTANAANALAFHVDYWDDLGWKDRFASHAFTDRQHQVANANRASFVYTPQVVLQGRSATDWRDLAPRLVALEAKPGSATITLAVATEGDAQSIEAIADIADKSRREGAKLYVATTSSSLSTQVRAGENRGETLRHDHVVRTLTQGAAFDASGHAKLTTRWTRPPEGEMPTIVAFVQDPARGDVLQSLALPLARCQR